MHSLLEEHLETICPNCRKEHDNHFISGFDEHAIHAHYLVKDCEHCGYEIFMRTNDSSGR